MPSRMPHNRLVGQRTSIPGVPVGLHLATRLTVPCSRRRRTVAARPAVRKASLVFQECYQTRVSDEARTKPKSALEFVRLEFIDENGDGPGVRLRNRRSPRSEIIYRDSNRNSKRRCQAGSTSCGVLSVITRQSAAGGAITTSLSSHGLWVKLPIQMTRRNEGSAMFIHKLLSLAFA